MEKSVGNRVIKGAAIILFVGVVAKIASFLYEAVLAYYIGTSSHGDAYHMISGVQAAIYPMLSIGIWRVFMPLYKSHMAKGERDVAESLANKSITFFSIISICVVILLIVLARAVVSVIAPGFEGEVRETCIRLVRLSAPMYTFILTASVLASMLQCHNKFFGSQIREVISHVPPILVAVILYRKLGPEKGVNALAISLVLSAFFRLIIEFPFMNWGYKFKPDFNLRTPEFNLMLSRIPSAMVSAGIGQLNTVIDKSMASMLRTTGTIASLNYSSKLLHVFSGLLSTPISTALYPQMIEYISLKKDKELSKLTVRIINIFLVLMIPISVACIAFRHELIAAVYQRGAFTAQSTFMTKDVFGFYCIGIVFTACNHVISNIFYGNGDTKTPMIISIVSLVLNAGFNFLFIKLWKASGLALSTSISVIILFVLRLVLSRKYVRLDTKKMFTTGIKVLIASLIACLIPRLIFGDASIVGTEYADRMGHLIYTNRYLLLAASAAIGIPIYLGLIKLLKITELKDLIDLFLKKLKKKKAAS